VPSTRFNSFLRDERGGYTLWSLVWFSLYVAMGGLAVDMTDAYRNQTLLQSTADASALAGVMSLPDKTDAVAQALAYATDNMNPSINGNVLKAEEVFTGNWNFNTRQFTDNGTPLNAVRVITRRADVNNNPLATNFLRILSLWGLPFDRWNISVEAVATRYVPDCLDRRNSLIAGNKVDLTSNNTIMDTCIHGQNLIDDPGHDYAVEIQNNGTLGEGTEISMPHVEEMIDRPTICSNDGLCTDNVQDIVIEGDIMPADSFAVYDTIAAMLDPTSTDYLPADLYSVDAVTSELVYPTRVTIDFNNISTCSACVLVPDLDPITGAPLPTVPGASVTYEYTAVMAPGTVYEITCTDPMDQLILPDPLLQPVLSNVAVLSACRIQGQSDMIIEGSVLASSAVGNGSKPYQKSTISFPSGVQFGRLDGCAPGGGVGIYSSSSVHVSAAGKIDGLQIVARGDIEFSAGQTADDLTLEAGHNIKFTANADLGTLCPPLAEDALFVSHYRLVR